ncbi:hypothetical protein D3C84_775410 [compost metagenome]
MTAELLKAPWTLHRRHRFHRCNKRGRQCQRQHKTTQFPFEWLEPCDEKRADETEDGKHREGDDNLFRAVVQDVFQKVTVAPDELSGDRVVEQLGQIHVQVGQFKQYQNDPRNDGDPKAHPEIERARGGACKGRNHASSLVSEMF